MVTPVPTTVRESHGRYVAACPLGEHDGATFDEAIRALQRWVDDAFPHTQSVCQTDENGSDI